MIGHTCDHDYSTLARRGQGHLSELVNRVSTQHGRVLVTVHGKPSAILLAPEDVASLEETIAVLSEPGTTERLRASNTEHAQGREESESDPRRPWPAGTDLARDGSAALHARDHTRGPAGGGVRRGRPARCMTDPRSRRHSRPAVGLSLLDVLQGPYGTVTFHDARVLGVRRPWRHDVLRYGLVPHRHSGLQA